MTKAPAFLTVGSAARALGVSEAYVRKLADAGKLPHVRTDTGQRLFRPEDVQRLARDRQKPGA